MQNITILNYQGNKSSLMPFINKNISKYVSLGDSICDIFSGSGSVGAYLKNSYSIISNDIEPYSAVISSALLNTPPFEDLENVKHDFTLKYNNIYSNLTFTYNDVILDERNAISLNNNQRLVDIYNKFPTIWNNLDKTVNHESLKKQNNYNLFLHYYSGTYFGIEQSIAIDSIIKTIHEIQLNQCKNVLYSCLFFAMKETVFSKDGHMAQPLNIDKNSARHLKQRSKDIFYYFILKLDEFIKYSIDNHSQAEHKIYNMEMSDLLRSNYLKENNIKLIYADPPYTDMQYSRYYHLLNVAYNYDYPKPTISRGNYTKGLYTEGRNQSELSKKSTAKVKLKELIEYCNKNEITLILSYAYPKDKIIQKTDRYTLSIEDLVNMAKDSFGPRKIQIEKENYKHANHRNSSSKEVIEYLIVCGQEYQDSNYNVPKLKKELKNISPSSNNPIYKTHLYWSQKSYNIIDSLINNLSNKGDIVFDPFMGSGVTVLESIKNNTDRIGIGCDINEMPKFIVNNIITEIPNADLKKIFSEFNSKLNSLSFYYETECPKCRSTGIISKVVFDKPKRTQNNFTIKAISFTCPICGKQTKEPDKVDYEKFNTNNCTNFVPNTTLIPNSKIAVGESDKISDIFSPRNFSVLNEIVGYIKSSNNQDILNYLLMSIIHLAKITDTHSNSQWPLWIPKLNCVEKNILDLLKKRMNNLVKAQTYINNNYSSSKIVNTFNKLNSNNALILTKGSQFITNNEIPDNSVSLIITDPPYMDQVLYSEYMQLYKPFIGLAFNLDDEIIVSSSPNRKRDKESYFSMLNEVFEMCKNKLKENHYMCLFFHDSNLSVWVNLINILENNGFKFVSQEHIKKTKTVKNILSPKKSLSGDAVLFFENTKYPLSKIHTSTSPTDIEYSVYLEAKKLLQKHGDLSTPELYDFGIMEMLIENGWLSQLSSQYKSLVDIFENHFIWKRETGKWHLQD